jgi:hypothetical protein
VQLKRKDYWQIRKEVKPGDIIAFGGKGNFSELIKWATRATVSHVGVIMQTQVTDAPGIGEDGYLNQIIESASLNGFSGVNISRLSDRVKTYNGEMWVLRLAAAARKKLRPNQEKFFNWCLNQDHKPYDIPQALKSALDLMDKAIGSASPTLNKEDFSSFFCSELAAGALEVATVLPHINASEVTPIDLCSFNIFEEEYYQIAGNPKEIKTYNSIDPQTWAISTGALHAAA